MEASWISLQRKAKEYERLKRDGGANDDPDNPDASLVDFLRKEAVASDQDDDDSGQGGSGDGEGWVEVSDEFGRTRIVRKGDAEKMKSRG